jgi:hypothetical protein
MGAVGVNRTVLIGDLVVKVLAAGPDELVVEGAGEPCQERAARFGRAALVFLGAHGNGPEAGGFQAVGRASCQSALAGATDPGDHGECRLALAQRRDQPLQLAPAADEPLAQALDAVAEQGVARPWAGGSSGGKLGSYREPSPAGE